MHLAAYAAPPAESERGGTRALGVIDRGAAEPADEVFLHAG